jgi:DNA repair photolyase
LVEYQRRDFKTILNKYKYIDGWFWCRYSVNPYNGCEFSCTYCDSRSHKYHLHPEFGQIVYVKNNVGPMLDSRISRARTLLLDVVGTGGTCDAYQPAEAVFGNTREVLGVLLKHGYPALVSTKSVLVKRDCELFGSVARASWCTVAVTVTTVDEELAGFLEPSAPRPQARLDAIREIKEAEPDVQTGVHLIPVVPFLCDDEESLRSVVSAAKAAKADFVLFGGGMTLRDNQARWYLRELRGRYPELVEEYLEIYEATLSEEKGYEGRYTPRSGYQRRINKRLLEICREAGISPRMKRFIPDDFRRVNYLVAQELMNESWERQMLGKAWTNLYWAGANINNLKESIEGVSERGELGMIRNVNHEVEAKVLNLMGRLG